ncbi:hypothetical protein ACIHDR_46855 [Nocardia sp. NPDC052278]|uniref:hypothetical protein n=1 Tax=unclassified Nocardia TaxID=2637762 RepID=UPI00369E643C
MSETAGGRGGAAGTRRGRPSRQPASVYDPAPPVMVAGDRLVVEFVGRDNRRRTYDFTEVPVPGMRADLAAAYAIRVGHTGTLHTLASANNAWVAVKRFTSFLAALTTPPSTIADITVSHLKRYRSAKLETTTEVAVLAEMRRICRVLMEIPEQRLQPDTRSYLRVVQLATAPDRHGVPGYSDEVFHAIMRAARSDIAAIRARIRAGEQLLTRAGKPGTLTEAQQREAGELAQLAATGEVPLLRFPNGSPNPRARRDYAARLFLVSADLAPLVLLGVGLTGRNGETIKELPAAHRLLDDRAVQLEIIKRRRGAGHWFADVAWEIGDDNRALHTPGGFYLLLMGLTARSRRFSGSRTVWSVWLNGTVGDGLRDHGGHVDPFAKSLTRSMYLSRWARRHGLTENGKPLVLTMNRVKTTVERRVTRAAGGHLPSAVRTNTQDVLFSSYLAGDPEVRDWAQQVITEAIGDAETAAREAHRRIIAGNNGPVPVLGTDADAAAGAVTSTVFASCRAIDDSPFNDGVCRASFLACFACRNAAVTAEHLPGLLDLLAELERRWNDSTAEDWWRRYGQVWLSITEDILPAFTPNQLNDARSCSDGRSARLLDLLEGPKDIR